jgi:hypothetical protein
MEVRRLPRVRHLFDTDCFEPSQPADLPHGTRVGHYNPTVREKYKLDANGDEQLLQRVRGTFDNRKAPSPYPVTHNPADLLTVKAYYNKVATDLVKHPQTLHFTMDIKDMYIKTPLLRNEYMQIPLKYISEPSIAKYNLAPFIHDGRLLVRLKKCLFGMPDVGAISKRYLDAHCP